VKVIRDKALAFGSLCVQSLWVPVLFVCAVIVRVIFPTGRRGKRRTTFGGVGIINFARWSQALRSEGYPTRTVVWSTPNIYPADSFDVDLNSRYGKFSGLVAPIHFVRELAWTDTIICGFDGFVLGVCHIRRLEPLLIRIAGRKTVVCPYGADAYLYRDVRSESTMHALQISYPAAGRRQQKIFARINRVLRRADFVFLGVMTFDGFGRWDALPFNSLVIDLEEWMPTERDWNSDELVVAHAPNHRGFKGTEFIIEAVETLQAQGEKIRLRLIEGMSNSKVRDVLCTEAHVLVEQLISTGYGMNGVEGLASGVVVVSNLEDNRVMVPMRRWSFARECPIVSASPETIEDVLRELLNNRSYCAELGIKSRAYAEKFHSREAFVEFYAAIDRFLWAGGDSLINFFHPLLGSFRSEQKNQR
jgi:hypothetical protein